ncbi:MAG TPA: cupin domain-containing protein [Gaiellales bacterium]|nr:cupin domain-containing protein [Gaiellales bacterium]
MAELADRLPAQSVRREQADLALANSGFGYVDVGSGPPSKTLLDIEQSGVRMTLRDIQQDPAYAEIINDCLDEVEGLVRDREGGMTRRAGYLFISAPASTTPMHFDVEHSFLLQVRGVKLVSVASFADNPSIRHRELDRYLDGEECDFEAMQAAAETTRLDGGVGVYLPSYVPHWVETESGVSVSFSIPFFTAYTERTEGVSRINQRLRRLHMSPRPPGESASVDKTKAAVFRSWQKLQEARKKTPV